MTFSIESKEHGIIGDMIEPILSLTSFQKGIWRFDAGLVVIYSLFTNTELGKRG